MTNPGWGPEHRVWIQISCRTQAKDIRLPLLSWWDSLCHQEAPLFRHAPTSLPGKLLILHYFFYVIIFLFIYLQMTRNQRVNSFFFFFCSIVFSYFLFFLSFSFLFLHFLFFFLFSFLCYSYFLTFFLLSFLSFLSFFYFSGTILYWTLSRKSKENVNFISSSSSSRCTKSWIPLIPSLSLSLSRGRKLADEMGRGKKFPWYSHRLMHRKRVTCELHISAWWRSNMRFQRSSGRLSARWTII